jgi:hypothetical protein
MNKRNNEKNAKNDDVNPKVTTSKIDDHGCNAQEKEQ